MLSYNRGMSIRNNNNNFKISGSVSFDRMPKINFEEDKETYKEQDPGPEFISHVSKKSGDDKQLGRVIPMTGSIKSLDNETPINPGEEAPPQDGEANDGSEQRESSDSIKEEESSMFSSNDDSMPSMFKDFKRKQQKQDEHLDKTIEKLMAIMQKNSQNIQAIMEKKSK